MSTADLKLDIFRKLDSLDNTKIKHLYGEFLNLINQTESIEDWEYLSDEQKNGIIEAESEYMKGKFVSNDLVMNKLKLIISKNA